MKDKSMWVMMLLIIVAVVFAINPDIIKQDDKDALTSFAVVPEAQQEEIQQQNTTSVYSNVVTEIRCLDIDDCVEEVRAQGFTEEIRASCTEGYCVFQMERLAVGGNVE
jgi:hypothetical protein